ncbi:MAG: GNAT family N-acetyltransferase [archaeon]
MKFIAKDGTQFLIRKPRSTDAKALLEYYNTLLEERPIGIHHRENVTLSSEKGYLKDCLRKIRDGSGMFYCVEKDKKIVGLASACIGEYLDIKHFADLSISILKEYRNKGLGSKLVQLLIEWAKKKKLEFIMLELFSKNKGAIRLYRRLGFKKVATLPNYIKRGKEHQDEIVMYLYL